MQIDLFSPEYAEALYYFVGDNLEDFIKKTAGKDLSMAEYVYRFKQKEFLIYCQRFGFLPDQEAEVQEVSP